MKFHQSYLSTAENIIKAYDGSYPLTRYLKDFFSANKKFGSRDRRIISIICYEYFRLGRAKMDLSFRERVAIAHFLCNQQTDELMLFLEPSLAGKMTMDLPVKIKYLGIDLLDIFPFGHQLSTEINKDDFILSFLVKPDTFLRIRPGRKNEVLKRLSSAGIAFTLERENSIRLEGHSNLEKVISPNKDAVVQDFSSQQVLDYLDAAKPAGNPTVWDCCAASGGKAILAYDKLGGHLSLTVSDIRQSIIINLKKRLGEAAVPIHHVFVENLEELSAAIPGAPFDIIVCDLPCTGSGTWSRNPEQLYFFQENQVQNYVQRQKKIAKNAAQNLKAGGLFFYITCSVFAAENEEGVAELTAGGLQLISQQYITGYRKKADTMYVAVLRNEG